MPVTAHCAVPGKDGLQGSSGFVINPSNPTSAEATANVLSNLCHAGYSLVLSGAVALTTNVAGFLVAMFTKTHKITDLIVRPLLHYCVRGYCFSTLGGRELVLPESASFLHPS